MQVIGHRGVVDSDGPVENTLAAVERAFAEGADGVEVDVRLTCDAVAVCVHDRDLHRVAGNCLEVARATLAEIRRVQLPGGHLVPTLAEVLEASAGRGIVVLDLKPAGSRTRAMLDRIAEDLLAVPREDVIVSTADVAALAAAQQALPSWRRALISGPNTRLRNALRLARDCDVDLHPYLQGVLADLPAVRAAVDRGQSLRPWTVNHETDLRQLADTGVAGVITDDARRAVSVGRPVPALT